MSEEIKTPRTDAVARWEHHSGLYSVRTTGTVDVEFAKSLERENLKLRVALEEIASAAVSFSHPKIRYCEVQISPDFQDRVKQLLESLPK